MAPDRRCATLVALSFLTLAPTARSADTLVYTALSEPCRVLDTRTSQGGPGALTAAHGNYLFGVSDASIEGAAQHGSSTGCGIPSGVAAVNFSFNQLATTAAGNIRAWSSDAGTTGPSAGTAVYNPSVATPSPGQVLYNGAFSTVAVGASDQKFYVAVANGQMDLVINATGYWTAVSTNGTAGLYAATVGLSNIASGEGSVAVGGGNQALGVGSLAMGASSTAANTDSVAIGTNNAKSTGIFATSIGYSTTASGRSSMALGTNATTTDSGSTAHDYSIVLGTDPATPTKSTADYQFMARAKGGFILYTGTDTTTGTQIAAGSGSWTVLSDRNAKTAVQRIDGRDVLERVIAMPLATWQYKTQDAKYRHMGPMAQDFYAAFGLGESDTGIDTIDADGVALAAIQGLNAKLEERDRQHDEDQSRIAKLEAQVAELAAAIKHPAGAKTP